MNNSTGKGLCFLLGATVGSIVALLYTPKSGRETREEISRRAKEGREFFERKIDENRNFAGESGRSMSNEVASLVERGKGEVSEFIGKGRNAVNRQKGQVAAAFEAGKEAYLQDKGSSD